jgi:hypothetical protein
VVRHAEPVTCSSGVSARARFCAAYARRAISRRHDRNLLADHEQARANRQMSAAIRAAELLGRELHGMFTERREVSTRDDIR